MNLLKFRDCDRVNNPCCFLWDNNHISQLCTYVVEKTEEKLQGADKNGPISHLTSYFFNVNRFTFKSIPYNSL